jgi:hypothetical protein
MCRQTQLDLERRTDGRSGREGSLLFVVNVVVVVVVVWTHVDIRVGIDI